MTNLSNWQDDIAALGGDFDGSLSGLCIMSLSFDFTRSGFGGAGATSASNSKRASTVSLAKSPAIGPAPCNTSRLRMISNGNEEEEERENDEQDEEEDEEDEDDDDDEEEEEEAVDEDEDNQDENVEEDEEDQEQDDIEDVQQQEEAGKNRSSQDDDDEDRCRRQKSFQFSYKSNSNSAQTQQTSNVGPDEPIDLNVNYNQNPRSRTQRRQQISAQTASIFDESMKHFNENHQHNHQQKHRHQPNGAGHLPASLSSRSSSSKSCSVASSRASSPTANHQQHHVLEQQHQFHGQESTFGPDQASRQKFQYVLAAPISVATKTTEDTMTYLNQGQAYEIKLENVTDLSEAKKGFMCSIINIGFHERHMQQAENELWQQWSQQRPSERIFSVDMKLSYNVFGVESDGLNKYEFLWDSSKVAGVFIRINSISTEFTPRKHGGEKGIPFKLSIETFSYNSKTHDSYFISAACCQIKVFKPKGAERKIRSDRDKILKRPLSEQVKYHQHCDYTIFHECSLSSLHPLAAGSLGYYRHSHGHFGSKQVGSSSVAASTGQSTPVSANTSANCAQAPPSSSSSRAGSIRTSQNSDNNSSSSNSSNNNNNNNSNNNNNDNNKSTSNNSSPTGPHQVFEHHHESGHRSAPVAVGQHESGGGSGSGGGSDLSGSRSHQTNVNNSNSSRSTRGDNNQQTRAHTDYSTSRLLEPYHLGNHHNIHQHHHHQQNHQTTSNCFEPHGASNQNESNYNSNNENNDQNDDNDNHVDAFANGTESDGQAQASSEPSPEAYYSSNGHQHNNNHHLRSVSSLANISNNNHNLQHQAGGTPFSIGSYYSHSLVVPPPATPSATSVSQMASYPGPLLHPATVNTYGGGGGGCSGGSQTTTPFRASNLAISSHHHQFHHHHHSSLHETRNPVHPAHLGNRDSNLHNNNSNHNHHHLNHHNQQQQQHHHHQAGSSFSSSQHQSEHLPNSSNNINNSSDNPDGHGTSSTQNPSSFIDCYGPNPIGADPHHHHNGPIGGNNHHHHHHQLNHYPAVWSLNSSSAHSITNPSCGSRNCPDNLRHHHHPHSSSSNNNNHHHHHHHHQNNNQNQQHNNSGGNNNNSANNNNNNNNSDSSGTGSSQHYGDQHQDSPQKSHISNDSPQSCYSSSKYRDNSMSSYSSQLHHQQDLFDEPPPNQPLAHSLAASLSTLPVPTPIGHPASNHQILAGHNQHAPHHLGVGNSNHYHHLQTEPPALTLKSDCAGVVAWLIANRFGFFTKTFAQFSGSDLLRLTKQELVEICGLADGIRLFNSLHIATASIKVRKKNFRTIKFAQIKRELRIKRKLK